MTFSFPRPEESPGFLLWQLTNEWQRKQRKALSLLNLTHPQFVVLAALLWLNSTEAIATQQQLSDLTKIDKMTLSDITKLLLHKKMIARSRHRTDGRAYVLSLTEKGKALALKAIPIVEGIDRAFFTSQTPGVLHLAKWLKKSLIVS